MTRRFTTIPPKPSRAPAAPAGRLTPQDRARFGELDQLHVNLRMGSYRIESLYWGVLGERWWRNYIHSHSFVEVCYAFSGRGSFKINDEPLTVERGDLFLAKPGSPHEIVSSRSHPLGIYFWAFTLLRKPEHSATDADRPFDSLLQALCAEGTPVARAPVSLAQTIEMLNEEICAKAPGYTRAVASLSAKLLLDIARTFVAGIVAESVPVVERGAKSVVQTAMRYLRDNYDRPIEVRDVAAQVHLSERHLSRLFARETGKSVLEFLTDLRIEAASQLLLDDGLSIKQIASAVGYPDQRYFTTRFGKKAGITPGEFRRIRGTRFREESRRGSNGEPDVSHP